MPSAYLYVLGASKHPGRVECVVPWMVDDDEIFFGPCKIPFREALRPVLLNGADRGVPKDDIYFVGFNALPTSRERRVVWAGRMLEALSFGRAAMEMVGPRYLSMRDERRASPLHLVPLDGTGRPRGYRHVGLEHLDGNEWVGDIVGSDRSRVVVDGREVRLKAGTSWWHGFPRDVCFRFENLFFAQGEGLEVDEGLLEILMEAQPERRGVDRVAIFGVNSAGRVDGRHGGGLELRGTRAERLARWLELRTGRKAKPGRMVTSEPFQAASRGRCR